MKKYAGIIIMIFLGVLTGFLGAVFVDYVEISFAAIPVFVICLAAAFYLQIILHEAGHLIMGLLTGYKFVSFRVGSLIFYKKNNRTRIGKYALAGTGGQCLLAPPDMIDGKIPYALYNLGGVFMNLLTAGICGFFLVTGKNGMIVSVFLETMTLIGIIFAATNGIPISFGEVDNDGRNTLNFGKTPAALKSLWLQLKVNEQMTEGKRLQEMPAEWFEMPTEELDNSMVASAGVFYCNRLMDEGDYEKAGKVMEEFLAMKTGVPGIYKILLTIDLIYCEFFRERRAEVIGRIKRKDIEKIMKAMKDYPAIIRTRYAYALLEEKDEETAKKLKERLSKLKNSYPYPQEIDSELELMEKIETIK